jgi:hypothetical protein
VDLTISKAYGSVLGVSLGIVSLAKILSSKVYHDTIFKEWELVPRVIIPNQRSKHYQDPRSCSLISISCEHEFLSMYVSL